MQWMSRTFHFLKSTLSYDKPKLKVKMQLVSDDDVRKDFLKSHVLSWW